MLDLRLILVSIMWGVNFSFVKFALTDFYPLSFTIVRFSLAALFLLGIMLKNREPFAIARRDIGPIVRLGLIGITLYNILFMYGLQYTTASNSALFIATSPLFAAVTQALTKKERLNAGSGFGFLLSTLGAVLIIRGKLGGLSFTWQNLGGDLLTLCAAFSWALYTMMARPLLEKYAPVKITAYTMAAGTVLLLPFGFHELVIQSWSVVSAMSWAALGFGAFFAGGLAYTLWYQGVKRIGVTKTMIYHYLMPFTAVIFAFLFLGERITVLQIIGGAAVLSGVAIVQRSRVTLSQPD
jgi:drug/metabolite transporter (DMT)-like permease